jgi:DNA-binding winged helix-turn-helix (wHTH) protein/tetratricopeptide (TPR) repeat protein
MQYAFGDYEFDTEAFELRHGGRQISATPQVLAILQLLLVSRPRVVTKDELVDEIWEGRAITDGAISVRMNALREAIGDNGAEQKTIQTVRGQGFRFVAPVQAKTTQEECQISVDHTADDAALSPTGGSTPPRPSVAVLPFLYLGASEQHKVLQYALPDELLTQLYKLQWLLVISRGSSFQLASHQHPPSEILERLGARYCVSGSVEVAPKGFIISTELADTISERVIWRDRRSIELEEIYEFRSELAQSIGRELHHSIERNELETALHTPISSLDSWQCFHMGMHRLNTSRVDRYGDADVYFRQSLALDPGMARARAGISQVKFFQHYWGNTEEPDQLAESCVEQAAHALQDDPSDPFCNLAVGRAAVLSQDYAGWRRYVEMGVQLSPSYAPTLSELARIQAYFGQPDEAQKTLEKVELLDPLSLNPESTELTRLIIELDSSRLEAAADRAEKMNRQGELGLNTYCCVFMTLYLAGRSDALRSASANMKRLFLPSRLADWFANVQFKNQDWKAAADRAAKTFDFV